MGFFLWFLSRQVHYKRLLIFTFWHYFCKVGLFSSGLCLIAMVNHEPKVTWKGRFIQLTLRGLTVVTERSQSRNSSRDWGRRLWRAACWLCHPAPCWSLQLFSSKSLHLAIEDGATNHCALYCPCLSTPTSQCVCSLFPICLSPGTVAASSHSPWLKLFMAVKG